MSVLLVESALIAAETYAPSLCALGLDVDAAADVRAAIWLVAAGGHRVVILDLDGGPRMWDLIEAAVRRRPPVRVVAVAAAPAGPDLRRRAYGAGVWELVETPAGGGRAALAAVASAARLAMGAEEVPSVLIVDDCLDVTEGIAALIAEEGYRVETATTADEAIRRLAARDYALLVTETRRIGPDGYRVMREAARIRPDLPIVVLSARMDDATWLRSIELGARACLWKLADPDEILKEVLAAMGAGQERGQRRA